MDGMLEKEDHSSTDDHDDDDSSSAMCARQLEISSQGEGMPNAVSVHFSSMLAQS